MRKLAITAALIAALASAGMALGSGDPSRRSAKRTSSHSQVMKLFAHTVQFTRIDLGTPGVNQGDQSALSDDLFTSDKGHRVGYDTGTCALVRVKDAATVSGTLQCLQTFSVRGGQIAANGVMELTKGQTLGTQTLAITGGTGRYRGAGGEAKFEFVSQTEANITLSISLPAVR
ncbi:MAG: allene oxide cyclase barrel-like domain-containing protein [Solirubrobacteraceae bacterium]